MLLPRPYNSTLIALAFSVLLMLPGSSAQNITPSSGTPTPTSPPISQLHLYRALFGLVAQMERDRLANDPARHVNMVEIEDHLRKKIDLSSGEWQTLVSASIKVDGYTEDEIKQARALAVQVRESSPSESTLSAARATRSKMQSDLNARVLGDIKELETAVGSDTTTRIHAYLSGPLTASAHVMPRPVHKKAVQ